MLIIKNLSIQYEKKIVIKELDLCLASNSIHGLVGLNGCGKTSLLNTIYGFIKHEAGQLHWNGKILSRKDISYLETTNYFYSNITGSEYLDLFPSNNKSFILTVWQDLLKLPLDEYIENYSTGMKKKLAFLGILKLDKPIILLDEPFNGIDLETARIMLLIIKKLKEKNKTIIVTSHILESLTKSCDFIHHLENKKVKRSYAHNEFSYIEQDIFHTMEKEAITLINNAV